MNWIFGPIAVLSFTLLLWQWLAARRFPLHVRIAGQRPGTQEGNAPDRKPEFRPAVTLLKPLKGRDAATEDCLRSWLAQDYDGPRQILFGVASAEDAVCEVVRKLLKEFPQLDAQLLVCGPLTGANAKVSKLAELEKLAKHEVIVISDADVRVPADLLANAVACLLDSEGRVTRAPVLSKPLSDGDSFSSSLGGDVGLVNCFYRLANPSTLAMQWEAIAINADFWSQVLQSQTLKPLDFALGAVMVTRRRQLEEIGGFRALVDCLADDYQLGNRIARGGHRIALCPVVVECWDPPMDWRAVWNHQLRWARTIRVSQPAPYFLSILSNVTLWAALWFMAAWPRAVFKTWNIISVGSIHVGYSKTAVPCGIVLAAVFCLARILIAFDLQRRLTGSSAHARHAWLVPIKDLLQAGIWLCAFGGNRIEWRGQKFTLRRDGTLEKP